MAFKKRAQEPCLWCYENPCKCKSDGWSAASTRRVVEAEPWGEGDDDSPESTPDS